MEREMDRKQEQEMKEVKMDSEKESNQMKGIEGSNRKS